MINVFYRYIHTCTRDILYKDIYCDTVCSSKKEKKNKEIETTLKSFIRELFESIIAHLHYEALNYVAIKKSKENLCW